MSVRVDPHLGRILHCPQILGSGKSYWQRQMQQAYYATELIRGVKSYTVHA